jgi:non-ribosomal peptide synthetase component F
LDELMTEVELATADPPAVFQSGPAAPARTLIDVLAQTAAKHPHAPAIDDGRRVVTYRRLQEEITVRVRELTAVGIGIGDRVGVRIDSGTVDLYVAILAVLHAGAAYVPVDADDPQERADLVFGEADVGAILLPDGKIDVLRPHGEFGRPTPEHDAWIIFTSGSTGKPKGVAVTHRSAAAFVDAAARTTGCWPVFRLRSTPRARRCGWPGGTGPVWCRRRGC